MRTRLFALAVLVVLVAACSPESLIEGAVEDALQEEGVDIDLEDGQVTVQSSDGTFSVGTNLPEGFPSDFPIPGDSEVQGGVSGTAAGGGYAVSILAPGTTADVAAYYAGALPEAGYEVTSTSESGDTHVLQFTKGGSTGSVALNTQGGSTLIAITIEQAE